MKVIEIETSSDEQMNIQTVQPTIDGNKQPREILVGITDETCDETKGLYASLNKFEAIHLVHELTKMIDEL